MLPVFAILENCRFSVFNDMKYIFQVGNAWTGLFLVNSWVFQENSEENIALSQKKLWICLIIIQLHFVEYK